MTEEKKLPLAHDYTKRTWGHDYTWTPDEGSGGHTGTAIGWGFGIEVGHILLLEGPNKKHTPYRVEEISYYKEPPDMWKARLRYEPDIYEVDVIKPQYRFGGRFP